MEKIPLTPEGLPEEYEINPGDMGKIIEDLIEEVNSMPPIGKKTSLEPKKTFEKQVLPLSPADEAKRNIFLKAETAATKKRTITPKRPKTDFDATDDEDPFYEEHLVAKKQLN
jgi:hypothetical protein